MDSRSIPASGDAGNASSQRERHRQAIRHANDHVADGIATREMLFDVLHTLARLCKRVFLVFRSSRVRLTNSGGTSAGRLFRTRSRAIAVVVVAELSLEFVASLDGPHHTSAAA